MIKESEIGLYSTTSGNRRINLGWLLNTAPDCNCFQCFQGKHVHTPFQETLQI